ncbi:hypothetical protein SISNIDRAFT_433144 [Sistotremastrum niveocremeum HHB9708]|uniref:Uncharacterized protein n=1 Tax=Sistotremastrum niveocremeum HHB9708 TaxID=1314777 RepID=A0A164NS86_9AGAM|nr:hypothetical protein SISNIDRAFT_433144 [Sistotremastrum niveocremeum HHB9708]
MQIVPPVQQSLPIQSTGFSNYGSLSPQGAPYLPSSISTPSSFDNRSVSLPTTLSANVPSNSFSGINSSLLPPFSQSPGLQSVNPFNTFQPMSNQLQTGQNFSGGFSQGPSELSMGSLQPGFNPSPFPNQTINNPSPFPPIQNQFQTQGQFGANFPFQNPPPVQQQQQFNPGFQPQGAFQPQQQTQTNPFMSNPTMWGPQQTGGPMGGWS